MEKNNSQSLEQYKDKELNDEDLDTVAGGTLIAETKCGNCGTKFMRDINVSAVCPACGIVC